MVKFECKRCKYQTNYKSDYDAHLNRKIPCDINRPHKKIKVKKDIRCEKCDHSFAREDVLTRHNKTFHAEINGDDKKINDDNIFINIVHEKASSISHKSDILVITPDKNNNINLNINIQNGDAIDEHNIPVNITINNVTNNIIA